VTTRPTRSTRPTQPTQPIRRNPRRGLTLIELVVVLALLAALATVAVRNLGGQQQQSRYQNTKAVLNDVQSAILGPSGSPTSGFVADVGRLPRSATATPAVSRFGVTDLLDELLTPHGLPAYSLKPTTDAQVFVGSGWQGPYLRLGAGTSALLDGWGCPFAVRDGTGTPIATVGTPIFQVVGLGADHLADSPLGTGTTDGYNRDAGFAVNPAIAADGWQAAVTVNVQVYDPAIPGVTSPGGTVTVRYFGPDGNGGVTELHAEAFTGNGWTVQFAGVPVGPRVLRAYYDGTNTDATGTAVQPTTAAKKSPVQTFVLRPGTQTINLVLPK
jgi:prepilin-type N-terminal cleavage/methylation domain-containing protein